jgi:alkaline phosphatase
MMTMLKAARAVLARFAFFAFFAFSTPASGAAVPGVEATPRNIIIMIADGAASTQWEFGRYSSRVLRGEPFATTDVVFNGGALGLMTTSANNAYVTDSAAAASAFATGYKVNVGAISVSPQGKHLLTVMEGARASGKRIGLVTTAAVYDATPAAFTVHETSRRNAQAIVDQYAAFQPDVLLGGGAAYFVPKGEPGSKRSDSADVIGAFQAKGYAIVRTTAELNGARGPRLLGLFADEDMMFETDRDAVKQPSTAEMAAAALKALDQESGNGFVLLVENENVDTAGHANDAAAVMRALWAFDDAVKVAIEFQRRSTGTLLIVTGDHETGGLVSRFGGDAQMRLLGAITMSFAAFDAKLGPSPSAAVLDQLLRQHFPGFKPEAGLRDRILKRQAHPLAGMVAAETGFSWSTTGHTAQPVAVGAIGPGAELFRGYQDNTDFGKHLHALLRAVSGER